MWCLLVGLQFLLHGVSGEDGSLAPPPVVREDEEVLDPMWMEMLVWES